MNRFDLAGFRSRFARAAARLRAESTRLPSLAYSHAGGNSIYRTLVGSAIVTAGSIAGLLSTRLGAFRSWRGTPPFWREAKASCRIDFPPASILLLAVLLLGVVEPRFAHGAEDDGPREKQAEAGPPPVDRESGASHQGTPSPVSAARPRGLNDALYMHVGIDLPALDATTVRTMRLQYGPDWLGPHRTLPESAAAELPGTWGLTVDGEPIWRVTIRSAQAAAIAIRFETFDADGEVWVYTHDGEAYAGPYSGRGPRANGAFWSDPLHADTVTVEYFPRQRGIGETKPPFRIPKISHHARWEPRKSVGSPLIPRRSRTPGSSERSSLTPYKDATCSLEFLRRGGHDQERLVDAVAMMVSRRDTGSYQCTAFVLRNLRERDRTTLPSYYDAVFTSGSCIRNQSEAVDATFYWKYRTSTCDGPAPSLGSLDVTRGARLWDRKRRVSTFGKTEDYALLLVPRDEMPSDVYRAGWTTADVVRGEDVYTLGHPRGEPLRLSVGDVDDPDEGTWLSYSPAFGVGSDYGRVGPGTSGSPVFGRLTEDGRLLGILSGTSESWFQSREWVVHKYGSVRGDFRHLRNVERETQRVSHRIGADTHWFTFYESNFLQGWVLNNKRVVRSGDTVAQGGTNFVVELRNGRWSVSPLDVHGNTRAAAASFSLGSSAEGSISPAGDVDWFRFETSVPTTVEVYTTGPTDTFGRLNGMLDDDGGAGANFRIEASVPAGVHYVEVSGPRVVTDGGYTLHIRSLSSENTLGMEFVWVPAGRFLMGSPEGEAGRHDSEVQHEVRISRGFWMGKYEVTQGEWEAVMGENPSHFQGCGARCPVESVSWEDAEEFIRRLNERETGTGNRYRLPTEAEWEYAARAGSSGATPEGELRILGDLNAPVLDGQAWYGGNSGVSYAGAWSCSQWDQKQYESETCGTHLVGLKRANAWGLHDMLGNVWEWTADWFGRYRAGPVTDPQGPATGSYRVYRGGGFNSYARVVRAASSYSESPDARHSTRGLRLVMTTTPELFGGGASADDADGRGDATPVAGATWANTLGIEFVWIPAGRFVMGSPEDEEGRYDNERQHEVRISRGYWLGRYEVTQQEWEEVMGENPSYFGECGARCPVERVSWDDTQEFIWRLIERESEMGYRYRLPSEAEWEYAARAGTTGARYGELEEIAWYWENSSKTTHPVGEKRANSWGLHDMLGNVGEWTADWYGEYPAQPVTDPLGPGRGSNRVGRGGFFLNGAKIIRSATRSKASPRRRYPTAGFRFVRTE